VAAGFPSLLKPPSTGAGAAVVIIVVGAVAEAWVVGLAPNIEVEAGVDAVGALDFAPNRVKVGALDVGVPDSSDGIEGPELAVVFLSREKLGAAVVVVAGAGAPKAAVLGFPKVEKCDELGSVEVGTAVDTLGVPNLNVEAMFGEAVVGCWVAFGPNIDVVAVTGVLKRVGFAVAAEGTLPKRGFAAVGCVLVVEGLPVKRGFATGWEAAVNDKGDGLEAAGVFSLGKLKNPPLFSAVAVGVFPVDPANRLVVLPPNKGFCAVGVADGVTFPRPNGGLAAGVLDPNAGVGSVEDDGNLNDAVLEPRSLNSVVEVVVVVALDA
jgi:hypothetical protein